VCYLGLVFKNVENNHDARMACCAAQMFLDSGDGVVFKGAVGPWFGGKRGHFHLSRSAAEDVVKMCTTAYAERNGGKLPQELFVHGRTRLEKEEWEGFRSGAGTDTRVVGVRIQPISGFKLFRKEAHQVLRGLAYLQDRRLGFLWTRGMIPRLRTYPGREIPNPLLVDVCRGDADLQTVMSDILALTKLNYNSCVFADGNPVTLKFADAVGEILTAAPAKTVDVPPLPFKYYI